MWNNVLQQEKLVFLTVLRIKRLTQLWIWFKVWTWFAEFCILSQGPALSMSSSLFPSFVPPCPSMAYPSIRAWTWTLVRERSRGTTQHHSFPPSKTLKHSRQTGQVPSHGRTAELCEVKDTLLAGKISAEHEENRRPSAASWQGETAILRKRDLVPDIAECRGTWFAMLSKDSVEAIPAC